MHEEVIAHMRSRIEQLRKIIALAHDSRMIAILSDMIVQAEADIAQLESERSSEALRPPQGEGGPVA